MNNSTNYYRYWGKARFEGQVGAEYHLLPYHCLDVAAAGYTLLKTRPVSLEQIAITGGIDEADLLPWLTFLLAVHDLGKFADGFQNQRPDLFQLLQQRSTMATYTADEHHTILGYEFCSQEFISAIIEDKPNFSEDDLLDLAEPWISAVTGHHGRPPRIGNIRPLVKKQFPLYVKDDTQAFVRDLRRLFMPKGLPFKATDYDLLQNFKNASWLVAGLAITADWLGSNHQWFEYTKTEIAIEDYWNNALSHASKAVQESGLNQVAPSHYVGIKNIFPIIETPTPLQQWIQDIPILEGPQLYLIEEVTGGGKTEAAIALAHRLMASRHAEGIYLALPTMATANAMHERVENIYHRLFEGKPSLILAHSAAPMVLEMERNNQVDTGYGKSERSASQDCTAWLSDSRKKALLADIGVGTIDQALLSVLPARHQSLRLFGLSRKVLVVDEVHACDHYVSRLLCTLLRFVAAFGGSAILLSATLPQSLRKQFLKAFAEGAGYKQYAPEKTDYPLVTHLSCEGTSEYPVSARKEMSRTVRVEVLESAEAVQKKLQAVIDAGGCACWVRNTVYDAMEAYSDWVQRLGEDRVLLFHARFALGDRLQIEQEVLHAFGPDSTERERKGKLLIATQVVEQSLDIDFDYMVSDLAPIDLLIQRGGRLRRHRRDNFGNRIASQDLRGEATLGILMPEVIDDAESDWYSSMFPNGAFVYPHHGQLWLTAHWLKKNGRFAMPEDARDMIEFVYGEEGRNLLSPALLEIEDEAEGADKGDASMGSLNSLSLIEGYKVTMNHWQDDTNAPTRLGEKTTLVRLARLVDGKLEPWITGTGHDWELSQLSLRQTQIKEESPVFEKLIAEAKLLMPDEGRYCAVIPLAADGDKWTGEAVNGWGKRIKVEYSGLTGLQTKGEDE